MRKYPGYALITGGSDGMGLEYARQLAAKGYNLVLVARDPEKLQRAVSSILREFPVQIFTISEDLSQIDAAAKIEKLLQERKIPIGLLINNAGIINPPTSFLKTDWKRHQEMISLMCVGYTDLTYRLLPKMLEKGGGGVILVSSVFAEIPSPYFSIYGAVKAFILQLGTNLYGEYADRGIDVLVVCPGGVDTNLFAAGGSKAPNIPLLSAEEVVKKALSRLGRDPVVSVRNKSAAATLAHYASKLLPLRLRIRLVKEVLKDKYSFDDDRV
jgi:uncharacterized protein